METRFVSAAIDFVLVTVIALCFFISFNEGDIRKEHHGISNQTVNRLSNPGFFLENLNTRLLNKAKDLIPTEYSQVAKAVFDFTIDYLNGEYWEKIYVVLRNEVARFFPYLRHLIKCTKDGFHIIKIPGGSGKI